MSIWIESDNPNGFVTGKRFSVDNPAPTIMAGGMAGDSLGHWHLHNDGKGGAVMPRDGDAAAKPPYRVPSMDEIRSLPWNGLKVASTFAGGGGSSTGYRMARCKVIWASEVNPSARESYAANMDPATILDGRDIREVSPDDVLSIAGLQKGELDIFDGSPPCVAFSTAGRRERGWGRVTKSHDAVQRQDDLFFEYARLLDGLKPKAFVAENVSGLVKGTAKGYFIEILRALRGCGYRVEARLLDAQWLGVPQARQRLIYVGVRDDLGVTPAFPSPLPYRYSVREALSLGARVVHDTAGSFSAGDITDQPSPAVMASRAGTHFIEADISRYAIGAEWDRLSQGRQSDKYFSLQKASLGAPCPTVTAAGGNISAASVVHPVERRKFTIAELKRICSFPDDYELRGSYADQWARCGNAVPPVMMSHIARVLRDEVFAKLGD